MKRRFTIIQIREIEIENDIDDETAAESAANDQALYGSNEFTIRESWVDLVEEIPADEE